MKMTPKDQGSLMGANPYNKNKEWDGEGKTGKAFVSADDSMAYVSTQKTVVLDKMEEKEEATVVEDTPPQEAPPTNRYEKVDYKKRYDDLKRHYDKKVNEFKGAEKDLRQQLNDNAPQYKPPTSPEELEQFKADNPAIYNVVETVSHMTQGKQLTDLESQLKDVTDKLALSEATAAYGELKALVPDFEEVRNSEAFHVWAEQQPQQIQDWVYNNRTDVGLAAKAIQLYKASIGQATPQTNQPPQRTQQEGADYQVSVQQSREEPSSKERIWTTAEIGQLSGPQYEQYKDEIDRAFAEHRIVQS